MTVRSATLLRAAFSAVRLAHLKALMRRVTCPQQSRRAPHRELNGRELIQMGTPVWWMLVFRRVICARVEAVEMRVGGVGI
jgi:hypothetical protein